MPRRLAPKKALAAARSAFEAIHYVVYFEALFVTGSTTWTDLDEGIVVCVSMEHLPTN